MGLGGMGLMSRWKEGVVMGNRRARGDLRCCGGVYNGSHCVAELRVDCRGRDVEEMKFTEHVLSEVHPVISWGDI